MTPDSSQMPDSAPETRSPQPNELTPNSSANLERVAPQAASPPTFADEYDDATTRYNNRVTRFVRSPRFKSIRSRAQEPSANFRTAILLVTIALIFIGLVFDFAWLAIAGSCVAVLISAIIIIPQLRFLFTNIMSEDQRSLTFALIAIGFVIAALIQFTDIRYSVWLVWRQVNWDAVGALGDAFGALGQILIAILALYVAWRQYIIEKDLTTQQNLITQQQTIDSYFQGISDLVLDDEGLLEDWPQERAIAEGRTAAILSSSDPEGKAKVIRFLSRSKLLTPLKRDRRLGRAIFDGVGGYAEDRNFGVRVIDLGVMLANADLSSTDLRWTDLSDANLIRADLSDCDLVKTNFSRTILYEANLAGTDLLGARFFYGSLETASPRSRTHVPDYKTGAFTGAVVETTNFSDAKRMSEAQRQYCCAWGGAQTRSTIPGGCDGIPDRLSQQQRQEKLNAQASHSDS